MSLRIGFDMDGVLADFSAAFYAVEDRLFGKAEHSGRAGSPEEEPPEEKTPAEGTPKELRRQSDAVWQAIRNTQDFWLSLEPTDPHAVRRIQQVMIERRWEVFFITQRPATLGETVQRQTQRWLVKQGFDLPSVLVVPGARGAAAAALSLDYLVDDTPKNCIDVKSESSAKPILIIEDGDAKTKASAKRLGISTVTSIAQALDILETAPAKTQGLLGRLAQFTGLR